MSEDLKSIADRVRNEAIISEDAVLTTQEDQINELPEEFEREEDVSVVDGLDEDDDDAAVIIGTPFNRPNESNQSNITEDDLIDDVEFELTDEDLKAEMPDLDEETFMAASDKIRKDIDKYRKDLIIRVGLTVDEANEAAMNRMKKLGKDENDSYLTENPNLGIIEINKTDADNLEFTEEEKEKLTKVKSIKLKLVEDVNLKNIKIEKIDKIRKSSMLQSLDTNLSHYTVPLPLMSDYCRFRGAQTIQLLQITRHEDSTPDEIISKKASLIYNQLASGANLRKYDDDGKIIMSYKEFSNKFLYHDMNMALYAILVASSTETSETELTCGQCREKFNWTYNMKSLLDITDINDDFKERFDNILGNKANTKFLNKLYEKHNKSIRVESPITKNIYELNYPSVARAFSLFGAIDPEDVTLLYLSPIALFIDTIYVYNNKTDSYIPVEEDEYSNLMDVLMSVSQEELDIILEFIAPYLYEPKFVLKSQCPKCGNKMRNELTIDNMIFLKARDSQMEIQS